MKPAIPTPEFALVRAYNAGFRARAAGPLAVIAIIAGALRDLSTDEIDSWMHGFEDASEQADAAERSLSTPPRNHP